MLIAFRSPFILKKFESEILLVPKRVNPNWSPGVEFTPIIIIKSILYDIFALQSLFQPLLHSSYKIKAFHFLTFLTLSIFKINIFF